MNFLKNCNFARKHLHVACEALLFFGGDGFTPASPPYAASIDTGRDRQWNQNKKYRIFCSGSIAPEVFFSYFCYAGNVDPGKLTVLKCIFAHVISPKAAEELLTGQ